jgi:hypothetical protein
MGWYIAISTHIGQLFNYPNWVVTGAFNTGSGLMSCMFLVGGILASTIAQMNRQVRQCRAQGIGMYGWDTTSSFYSCWSYFSKPLGYVPTALVGWLQWHHARDQTVPISKLPGGIRKAQHHQCAFLQLTCGGADEHLGEVGQVIKVNKVASWFSNSQ